MVDVVQLVRASDCGSECRGFESHLPPKINPVNQRFTGFLVSTFYKMVYHLSFLFPHDCGDEMSAAAAFSKLA